MNRTPWENAVAGTVLLSCSSSSGLCPCPSAQAVLLTVGKALGGSLKEPQLPGSFLAFGTSWYLFDYSHLFLWLECHCIPFPTLANGHFYQSPLTNDMWIDFTVHKNEKTLQALQRVRVKTIEKTVQTNGPWLEKRVAELTAVLSGPVWVYYTTSIILLLNNKKNEILGHLGGSVSWASDFSSGHDVTVCGFKPHIRLCADSSEPGACFGFRVSLSLSLSLSLSPSPALILSLYFSQK